MKKKLLSLLLALCLVMALVPMTAFAEENEQSNKTSITTVDGGCRTIKYFLLGGSPALCPNGGEIGCDFAPSLINTVHSQTSLSACLI